MLHREDTVHRKEFEQSSTMGTFQSLVSQITWHGTQLHPSIQRTPFLLQAGASSAGKNFASKHSEAMFLPGLEPHKVRKEVEDVRYAGYRLQRIRS